MVQNDMSNLPNIIVQIVHIEGGKKGEIDELSKHSITIGRDTMNDIVFPKDALTVSRKHATINREGHRYFLVNQSKNGCFVNGRLVDQTYLKQGDVITFSKAGPKISFLYTMQPDLKLNQKHIPCLQHQNFQNERIQNKSLHGKPINNKIMPKNNSFGEVVMQNNIAPVTQEDGLITLQFGTTIRSFRQHRVTLGSDTTNDFIISDQRVANKHASIYFYKNSYYLSNIGNKYATLLNGSPVSAVRLLQKNDIVVLGESGPKMRYLGTGRLAEVIHQPSIEESLMVAVKEEENSAPVLEIYADSRHIDVDVDAKKSSMKSMFRAFFI